MTYQVGSASHESLIPRINLAIGPACPVRCEGCYNEFNQDGLVTGDEVIAFVEAVAEIGIRRAIVSGGDPLSHPEMYRILGGMAPVMDHIRLDTVGTAFLPGEENIPLIYQGRGTMKTYDPAQFRDRVSLINVPRDGLTEEIAQKFRHGRRSRTLAEGDVVAARITGAEIPLGINTVVNRASLTEVPGMLKVVKALGASQWRLFQFDPTGSNKSRHANELVISNGEFTRVTDEVREESGNLAIFAGSLANRGTYHMVDSAGRLYERTPGVNSHTVGHITEDRELVLDSLRRRIESFYG